MPVVWVKRALYRARQFLRALLASLRPLDDAEQAEVRAVLTFRALTWISWAVFCTRPWIASPVCSWA